MKMQEGASTVDDLTVVQEVSNKLATLRVNIANEDVVMVIDILKVLPENMVKNLGS